MPYVYEKKANISLGKRKKLPRKMAYAEETISEIQSQSICSTEWQFIIVKRSVFTRSHTALAHKFFAFDTIQFDSIENRRHLYIYTS